MASDQPIDPHLTLSDHIVLQNLLRDVDRHSSAASGRGEKSFSNSNNTVIECADDAAIVDLLALNNPRDAKFSPVVFASLDLAHAKISSFAELFLRPYISWARTVVRRETDVVMVTHIILYFTTLLPSAFLLFYHFTWIHGVLHWLLQSYYASSYTLMIHQHVHMRGVMSPQYAWLDRSFPYILDLFMGHTWNTYYYHHVKHHHVESNGPDDLSSTIRYQRDSLPALLHYIGRFFFLIWLDIPRYFLRKGQPWMALKAASSEFASYFTIYTLARYVDLRATIFTIILPLSLLRVALMVGNWGQHAFVDEVEPTSDFRSSITLIDVVSNRYCYNDGYHTSHHLNPRRHWRDHPVAFLKAKRTYAEEQALVFRNIDYIVLTIRLMMKDYTHIAKCLVPIGAQIGMSVDEIAAMLRTKTRAFSEEEIRVKFAKQ